MIVYHGTTLTEAHALLRDGAKENLYVTTDKKHALNYAIYAAAIRSKGMPAIVKIVTNNIVLDPDYPDRNDVFVTTKPSKVLKIETKQKWTAQVKEYKKAWDRDEFLDVVV